MTYIVTEPCICCKYTQCVQVCPVDCFKSNGNFIVIDPNECIDCGLCEPECPIGAIKQDINIEKKNKNYLQINKYFAKKWSKLNKIQKPLPFYKEWEKITNKIKYLQIKLLEVDSNHQPNG